MRTGYRDLTADEVRAFIKSRRQGTYTLLDVRQDWEYEEEHIPGSFHIPLPELSDRLHEIPRDKPAIAYCRSGGRSSAAAAMLRDNKVAEVYNLTDGMSGWRGEAAVGPGSAGLLAFSGDESTAEVVALACRMEVQLGDFYRTMAKTATVDDVRDLLEKLADFEDRHQTWLLTIYQKLTGEALDPALLTASAQDEGAAMLEGGLTAEEFIRRNTPALDTPTGVIEAGMMFEAQALDLYTRYAARSANEASRALLYKMADEEKRHLKALGTLLDKVARKD
ncbi:rhodanese-related sulfurtransferase/rubrerythrin [Desulfobaculum xiamenense]|uniref:Rhodanese-related sulfurtransferase/rubrerythrin n=1 Tax=Desulfobaculum xiamenense TaxID=995050 RepID=A0A846QFJ8_9BACT|nr:rhodanese-like domain-containing protein [Desulfobaculum xiamenense]NJB67011.1 rhodanese-related sulfurtransferase/rubrerythrin [Desulfobaculum xiamenense]